MQASLTDAELSRFLLAIVLLLGSAHSFGYLFQRVKVPRVIGEIFGGLLLGPTALGALSPELHRWLFAGFDSSGKLLSSVYWLGLVLLMFVSGFDVQKSLDRADRRLVAAVIVGGTVLPFLTGWFAPTWWDLSSLLGPSQSLPALRIVLGIAVAVTSIPVISKIFMDLDIIHTRFAKIVLCAATIEDVVLWAALAAATGIAQAGNAASAGTIRTIFITVAFFAASSTLLPRLLRSASGARGNLLIKSSPEGYALLVCFVLATLASLLGINIVFGALLAGTALGVQSDERLERVRGSIKSFSFAFFVPIYFALVGLKLDLFSQFNPAAFAVLLLAATAVKMAGTMAGAAAAGKDALSCLNLGVAMNARGGPGIVLATVALDAGIISGTLFTSLILLSMVSSLAAGSWFGWVLSRRWELLR